MKKYKDKNFKKTVFLSAALCLSSQVSYAAETLVYSDYGPNRGSRYEALEWFAQLLNEKTGKDVSVDYHWGGSLMSMSATLNGLSTGAIDMGTVLGFAHPKELRAYNIADLPVDNSDVWVGLRSMYELATTNDYVQSEFKKQGITYVSNFSTGPVQLICRQEVKTLDELKGLKIRASGPYGDAFTSLGANVVRMPQSEVYQALDSGLLDCNQVYYYSIVAYRQFEVAPYVLELDWGQNMSFGIFIGNYAYDRLSDEQKQTLKEVGGEFIDKFSRIQIEKEIDYKEKLASGFYEVPVTINTLSDSDKSKLSSTNIAQVNNWVENAKADGVPATDILNQYESIIDKYKGVLSKDGYPWAQ